MSELVQFSTDKDIAIITINNPPVNALGHGVPEGIEAAIARINSDDSIKAAVLIGAGKTFIAGADINMFVEMTSGKGGRIDLLPTLLKIEDCRKPVVVALHGNALGGGLEVAQACHYRLIAPGTRVGQPEVNLGIIPGAGGTQRLPRLAGVAKAVEMCTTGKPVAAADALEAGIVDTIIEGDLLAGAIAFAREIARKPVRKTRDRNEKLGTPSSPPGANRSERSSAASPRRSRQSRESRPPPRCRSTKAARKRRASSTSASTATNRKP
jgi:3-hydroxyacyl-CoA dehydrogenase